MKKKTDFKTNICLSYLRVKGCSFKVVPLTCYGEPHSSQISENQSITEPC